MVTGDLSDKVTQVQLAPANGPGEWQRDYAHHARRGRRIAPALPEAAD